MRFLLNRLVGVRKLSNQNKFIILKVKQVLVISESVVMEINTVFQYLYF